MASSNIARLGVVLGIDTASFRADVDEAISANKKLKDSIERQSQAAAKEIAALTHATQDYGKEVTKVKQIEREIAAGRFENASPALKQELLSRARAYDALAVSSKKAMGVMTDQQRLQLTYQTTDLVTQIASGQNAMVAMLQQGGQLKDAMGGLGNMFRMLATFITPMNVALTATVAVLGSVGYAFYKGQKEASDFRDQMILTNQYANITLDGFQKLSNTLSDKLNIGLTDTKDVFMSLVSSGKFTEKSIGSVGTAILNVSKLSGETVSVVAGRLIPAFDGTASSAKRLNDQYHFLTLEQYKNIELLQKQNKLQESAKLTADAFNQSLAGQQRQLGYVERAWNAVTNAARESWAAILNLGAEDGAEAKLTKLRKALESAQQDIKTGFLDPKVSEERARRIQEQITKLESDLEQKKQQATKAQQETQKIDQYASDIASGKAKNLADLLAKQTRDRQQYHNKLIEEANKKNQELYEQEYSALQKKYKLLEDIQEKQDAADLSMKQQQRMQLNQLDYDRQILLLNTQNKDLKAYELTYAKDILTIRAQYLEQENQINSNEALGEEYKRQALEQNIILRDRSIAQAKEALDIARQESEGSFQKGFGNSFDDFVRNMPNQLELGKQTFNSLVGSMDAALENFVRNGKFNFGDFTRSVLQNMILIQARANMMSMMKGVWSMFGGGTPSISLGEAYGGGTAGSVGISGFADGGSPPVGMPSLVGERGPELFVPRTAGTIIPNDRLASAMGGGQTINYNGPYIANMSAIDTQSGAQFLAKNKQAVWATYQSANRSIPVTR